MSANDLFFEPVSAEDVDAAYALEVAGYPADEAATLEALRYRQSEANELFLGAYARPRVLRGFVCATRSSAQTLTHESMARHEPEGETVCVHSVCVDGAHRRQGVASALLREYVRRLSAAAAEKGYKRVLLIAHEELIALYRQAGFALVGPSAVTHGARQWFEMSLTLEAPAAVEGQVAAADAQAGGASEQQSVPPGVWEALAAASSPRRKRPEGKSLDAFAGVGELAHENERLKYDLLCARPECSSVILRSGGAVLVESPSLKLEPTPHPVLAPLPAPPTPTHWWHVTGGPMAFENVGFTKPTTDVGGDGQQPVKLLACAECDTGPIGWSLASAGESWVHVARVAYRV